MSACTGSGGISPESLKLLEQRVEAGVLERNCDAPEGWRYPGYDLKANHLIVSTSDGGMGSHGGSARLAFDKVVSGIVAWSRSRPKPDAPTRVMFYFNGGLNSEATVTEQAVKQVPCMLADGVYPVFMVWDTAALDSYAQQTFHVRDGQTTERAYWRTGWFYVLADAVGGLGRAPRDYWVHSRRYWKAVRRNDPCFQEILWSNNLKNDCSPEHEVKVIDVEPSPGSQPAIVSAVENVVVDKERVDEHYREVAATIAYGAYWPFRAISTPFADGFGKATWDNYLRRTRTTVRRPIEFYLRQGEDDPQLSCPQNLAEDKVLYPEGTGAFAKIFQLLTLAEQGKSPPDGKWTCRDGKDQKETDHTQNPDLPALQKLDLQLTLIGHSMGSITINELVYRFPELPYSDIVYMAAAASTRDTRRAIEPLLRRSMQQRGNDGLRFYNLVLHPLNDARERSEHGAVPSGSLLVWIDEMYEPAKTPEDRTFGYWPNVKAARFIFERPEGEAGGGAPLVADRMLYRVFSRPPVSQHPCKGPHCVPANPHVHGAFNDDSACFWRPAFWGAAATTWRERYRDLPSQALEECMVEPEPFFREVSK
jgi:hypothetical protein